MLTRIITIVSCILVMACATSPFYCPTPEAVKLRKTKAHRMRYELAKYKEDKADKKDSFKESEYKKKELAKIEEWDCPKPGLKHDRMVQKKAKDLQRRYAHNLKKVARESEERTVTTMGQAPDANKQ